MRVACFLFSRLSRASSIGSQVLFFRQQVGRGSVAYLALLIIGSRLVAVVGKSIPGHLLKDVGLPEFNWSPKLGVCFQHLWKRARCFVPGGGPAVRRVVGGNAPQCLARRSILDSQAMGLILYAMVLGGSVRGLFGSCQDGSMRLSVQA